MTQYIHKSARRVAEKHFAAFSVNVTTYGAVCRPSFLFLIGSDMLTGLESREFLLRK